uniref:Uncharacterized protein n=1 Tax=Trichobilharzia regenti TaxID=157069 RepID=A0AA85J6U9_TRIRE|nr:unnamed protein product [Trichobilharzia regenti]
MSLTENEIDWQTLHNHIHKLICSVHPKQEIKQSLECLFEKFLHTSSKTSIYTSYQKECFNFIEIDTSIRYAVMQFALLLDLNFICERLFTVLTNDHLDNVDWLHILQLISVIVTCIKGGVTAIKSLIRQLLSTLFNGSTVKFNTTTTTNNNTNNETFELDYLRLLDDVFNNDDDGEEEQEEINVDESRSTATTTTSSSNVDASSSMKEHDRQRLTAAILLARQLCSEDSRLTGITYSQWWNETFCTPLPSLSLTNTSSSTGVETHSSPQCYCILSSRHTVFYFTDLLIDLLPWENDVRFLQVQLNTKPNWFNTTTTSKKSVNTRVKPSSSSCSPSPGDNHLKNTGSVVPHGDEEEEGADDDIGMLLVPVDMLSGDSTTATNNNNNNIDYMEACMNRWNDYCEIGRGRLAELREHCNSTRRGGVLFVESKALNRQENSPTTTSTTTTTTTPTPGWCDVLNWLTEIATECTVDNAGEEMSSSASSSASCRLLSKVNEANLFRPRWLRCTIIPALLHAPEIGNLSSELSVAREQLLTTIRTAGLSHVLDNSPPPPPPPETGINMNPLSSKRTNVSKKRLGSTAGVSKKVSNKKRIKS